MSIELDPIGFVRTEAHKVPELESADVDGALVINEAYTEGGLLFIAARCQMLHPIAFCLVVRKEVSSKRVFDAVL